MEEGLLKNIDNLKINTKNKVSDKEDLLMKQLTCYFNNIKNINYMIPIIQSTSKISLRMIDWFITNYAKSKNIRYISNNSNFRVHHNYKSQLKAYSKKRFDPFCRRERIAFQYNFLNIENICDNNNKLVYIYSNENMFINESNIIWSDFKSKFNNNIKEININDINDINNNENNILENIKNLNLPVIIKIDSLSNITEYTFDKLDYNKLINFCQETIITTVGQLNFFRWSIDNSVLDYIDNNYNLIEQDMIINGKKSAKDKKKIRKKKIDNIINITVKFD